MVNIVRPVTCGVLEFSCGKYIVVGLLLIQACQTMMLGLRSVSVIPVTGLASQTNSFVCVDGKVCSVLIKISGVVYTHLYVAGKVCSVLIKEVSLFQG